LGCHCVFFFWQEAVEVVHMANYDMLSAAEFCSAQWHGVWVYNWPHTCIRDWHSHSWLWHATAFYAQVLLTVVSICFFASWIPCSSFFHTHLSCCFWQVCFLYSVQWD
jgi:hypothetical protein